jgi:hypothetical protein
MISPDPVDKSVDKMFGTCVLNVKERGLEALPIIYANAIST